MLRGSGRLTVIQGEQYGDEGKGKVADEYCESAAAVVRYNGGRNAGHVRSIENGDEITSHIIPTGAEYPHIEQLIIGNGCLIEAPSFLEERAELESRGLDVSPNRLKISYQSHLVLPHHVLLDHLRENSAASQGSTKVGIAFVASDKKLRLGVQAGMIVSNEAAVRERIGESFKNAQELGRVALSKTNIKMPVIEKYIALDPDEVTEESLKAIKKLKPFLSDTPMDIKQLLFKSKRVLAEGAQAFGLDPDHGGYPEVTSTATTVLGAPQGLGIHPKYIAHMLNK